MKAERPEDRRGSTQRGKLLSARVTGEIIGAFFEVRRDLKPGYLESVYRNALEIALRDRNLEVDREVPLAVHFRGQVVGTFRADLLVERAVIIEVKSADRIHAAHAAQLVNYLKTTNLQVGLLLNFGPYSEYRRVVWSRQR